MGRFEFGKPFKKELEVDLSEREIHECAMAASHKAIEYQEAESDAKSQAAANRNRLKRMREDIEDNSKKAATGKAFRLVECSWSLYLDDGVRRLHRHDTMEVIETKDLTPEERRDFQPGLFGYRPAFDEEPVHDQS